MKWLLIVSLLCFLGGVIELTRPHSFAIGLPLGAVFLGLYFVVMVFSRESAKYDEEQKLRNAIADRVK
jgi:hypothetical protein